MLASRGTSFTERHEIHPAFLAPAAWPQDRHEQCHIGPNASLIVFIIKLHGQLDLRMTARSSTATAVSDDLLDHLEITRIQKSLERTV